MPAIAKQLPYRTVKQNAPVEWHATVMDGKLVGQGSSFSSFGEIVQGRLSSGEDFLVTLPVDLWSTCTLRCEPVSEKSFVISHLKKSGQVAEHLLSELNLDHGLMVQLEFDTNIPTGKGLSSSTADMLAVVRAFQEAFDIIIDEQSISRLFTLIEPHDGLHYGACVAYNHRQGKLLKRLHHIPSYHIIAVDGGGELSTVEYNRKLTFTPQLLEQYDQLYDDLTGAFAARDDPEIARCAHRSAELHVKRTGNSLLNQLCQISDSMEALGVLATHSGTCGGLLFPGDISESQLKQVEAEVASIDRLFRTKTLQLPI